MSTELTPLIQTNVNKKCKSHLFAWTAWFIFVIAIIILYCSSYSSTSSHTMSIQQHNDQQNRWEPGQNNYQLQNHANSSYRTSHGVALKNEAKVNTGSQKRGKNAQKLRQKRRNIPSTNPTLRSTVNPTNKPTSKPTKNGRILPYPIPNPINPKKPTKGPSISPTYTPSETPTIRSTQKPSVSPIYIPSENPTKTPTNSTNDVDVYRFDIYIEIMIDSTNINVGSETVKDHIKKLMDNNLNLNEDYLIRVQINQIQQYQMDRSMNIRVDIYTLNQDDMNTITNYINSNGFEKQMENIMHSNSDAMHFSAGYTDNEESGNTSGVYLAVIIVVSLVASMLCILLCYGAYRWYGIKKVADIQDTEMNTEEYVVKSPAPSLDDMDQVNDTLTGQYQD